MNKAILLFSLLTFSFFAPAEEMCKEIVSGYEKPDNIYVICDDLSGITHEEANKLIKEIFSQYKGPPDEVFIFFVNSQDFVGKFDIPPYQIPSENWVADYYTHHNKLTLWPKLEKKTRVIKIQL